MTSLEKNNPGISVGIQEHFLFLGGWEDDKVAVILNMGHSVKEGNHGATLDLEVWPDGVDGEILCRQLYRGGDGLGDWSASIPGHLGDVLLGDTADIPKELGGDNGEDATFINVIDAMRVHFTPMDELLPYLGGLCRALRKVACFHEEVLKGSADGGHCTGTAQGRVL